MKVTSIQVGLYQTNCYIIEGDRNGEKFCIVVDPGDNPDLICSNISGTVTHVVLTHTHFDHILALDKILEAFPSALLCYSSSENVSSEFINSVACSCLGSLHTPLYVKPCDIDLVEGTDICGFKVIETPGHTMGSVCLYNASEKILISGDTLFYHSFGRTDLGGSTRLIIDSLKKLFALPVDTIVYPGHGEYTSIDSERKYYHRG